MDLTTFSVEEMMKKRLVLKTEALKEEQKQVMESAGPAKITKAMRDYKTERILFLGRSGTGKTYTAIKYVT